MADRHVVLIDARMARRRETGAATYIRDLSAALRAAAPGDLDIRVVNGPPGLPRRNVATTLGNLLLDLAWIHVAVPLLARRHRASVIHAPFNWGPARSNVPVVVTVQDLAWERVPETFPKLFRAYARRFTRRSARTATRIITTSSATAADLTALYDIPPDRIQTIPIGVAADHAPNSSPREPFILAVGEFEPRKRILALIDGHARYLAAAPSDPPPCRLVLAGRGGSQERVVGEAAGPDVERLGFVPTDALNDLYRRATLLVYPSSYEGFGLPVAEAMAHGCPVLVARNSSLPEVAGAAGLYLDDPTPDGIARTLLDVLADRDALTERGAQGRRQAAVFDWAAIAERTIAVYREAAGA